ncbi:MAG: hypothetical protein JWQ74_1904 [Marmoricola sp.]|nr:hypothetical protein [Marmoricola sp.]
MRRPPHALVAALAFVAAGTLGGCATDESPAAAPTTSAAPTLGTDPTQNISTAHDYFAALATNDVDELAKAVDLSASGSVAARYATYKLDAAQALEDTGEAADPDLLNESAPGEYSICVDSSTCIAYREIVLSDGKVSSFSVAGTNIAKLVGVGNGEAAPLGDLGTVEFLSRYENKRNDLLVLNLKVTSADEPLTLANDTANYRTAEGEQYAPVHVVGETALPANSSVTVTLVYDKATAPGALDYDVSADGGKDEGITLRVR